MHIGAFFVHFGNTFAALPAIAAMAWGLVFFATPYVALCGGNWLLTQHVLPGFGIGIGHRIDPRPLRKGQLRDEMLLAALSILIFGIGVVLPWWCLQKGWALLPRLFNGWVE